MEIHEEWTAHLHIYGNIFGMEHIHIMGIELELHLRRYGKAEVCT
jgi:hypothetical protein